MKIVEPSVEYWQQGAGMEGIWNQIAKATRVCYQSSVREGESSEDFVKRVILKPALIEGNLDDLEHCKFNFDKMHGAMLEHGTIYLDIDSDLKSLHELFMENPYSMVTYDNSILKYHYFVTTNMRVIIENNLFGLLEDWMVEPTEYHDKRYSFSIISNIGVTREANRHRVNSPSEESTRWCTYSAGKFGSEISYAYQPWMGDTYKHNVDLLSRMNKDQQMSVFKNWCKMIAESDIENWTKESYLNFGLKAAEFSYLGMKKCKASNDEARTVLNLGTKTQEIITAFDSDWKHFLELRNEEVSGHVHPDIQLIAKKIKDIIENL